MSWGLPGAILFLLSLVLLLGYFLSKKVFPSGEAGAHGEEPSEHSPCEGCGEPGCGGFGRALLRGGPESPPDAVEAPEKCISCQFGSGCVSEAPQEERKAAILCRGLRVPFRYRYSGAPTCRAAALMPAPPKSCGNACLGFGDCVRSCPRRAIRVEDGIARVDLSRCDGCGKCQASCPLGLIALIPAGRGLAILCKGAPGPSTGGDCTEGCTTCGLCIDACPEGALEKGEDGIPLWIADLCTGCVLCADACPQDVILIQQSTARRQPCHPKDAADRPSNSM